ncbi:MAG: PKD domain-containing protein [Lewinellaceae bacterium]|nr:PKD domain-containing protein [Lewinellaceae bacterium]
MKTLLPRLALLAALSGSLTPAAIAQEPYIRFYSFSAPCGSDCYEAIAEPVNFYPGSYTYTWSNGSNADNILICQPGCYSLTITNGMGLAMDSTFCVEQIFKDSLLSSGNDCGETELVYVDDELRLCEQACLESTITYYYTPGDLLNRNFSIFGYAGQGAVFPNYVTDEQFEVSWAAPGPYLIYINARVEDGPLVCNTPINYCVEVQGLPGAAIASIPAAEQDTVRLCAGQPLYLQYGGEEADSLAWNLGNGATSNTETLEYTFPAAGVYDITLTAFTNCNCNDADTLTVEVLPVQSPVVDCIGTVCENTLSTYHTAAGCSAYIWSVSDNGSIVEGGGAADNFITVNWEEGPEGQVELLTEGCGTEGCPAPAVLVIPIISEAAEIRGPALACRGERATYTLPGYEGTEFQWSTSAGGFIEQGQGSPEITVLWSTEAPFDRPQWVTAFYDNCYLGCGGSDSLAVNIRPEFYLEGPPETCPGEEAVYAAISLLDDEPLPCYWSIETLEGEQLWASAGPQAMPAIAWPYPGGYYRLKARPAAAGSHCNDAREKIVSVERRLPPPDSIIGDATICPGSVHSYRAASSLENVRFEWQVANGGQDTILEGKTVNIRWADSPPYGLTLRQIPTNGLPCPSLPQQLDINALGALAIEGPAEACQEDIILYQITGTGNIPYQWTISPPSAGTIVSGLDENEVSILWHQPGPAEIQASACGQNASLTVQVNAPPVPIVIHPPALCPGEQTVVQTSQSYLAYRWHDSGGSLVSSAPAPGLSAGRYYVEVTNDNGCQGKASFYIEPYPESSISISTPGSWRFCGDVNAPLYATSTSAGYQYRWYRNGAPTGGGQPEYLATSPGDYRVEITDQNGCTLSSNVIQIRIDCGSGGSPTPPPVCLSDDFDFAVQPGGSCQEYAFQSLVSGHIPGSLSWSITGPDGSVVAVSAEANPTFILEEAGFYRAVHSASFEDAVSGETIDCRMARTVEVRLAAAFSALPACAGDDTPFQDLSTHLPFTSIAAWAWDFGDPASGTSNTSGLPNPQHRFSGPGNYVVRLTVTDAGGCASSIARTIIVEAAPDAFFAEPASACAGAATAFTTQAPGAWAFQWDFGDPAGGPANSSILPNPYHRYAQAGAYEVTLTAGSLRGCTATFSRFVDIETNTLSGEIDINPLPPRCEGDTLTLAAPPGGIRWAWNNGDSTALTTAVESGYYQLTVTDAQGCRYKPEGVALDFIPAPKGAIRAITYDDYGQAARYHYGIYETCYGEDVYLEVLQETGYAYQWETGAATSQIEFSDEKGNLLAEGTHEISLTATDENTGCSALIGPFIVIVHPLPDRPAVSSSMPPPLCRGPSTVLSVESSLPGVTYLWSNGEEGPAATADEGGRYYVTAINPFGCEIKSDTLAILAGPDIRLIPNGCYNRCRPDTLCLPPVPGVVSYQWYFNGGPVAPPAGTIPELAVGENGVYSLEMVDSNGCTAQSEPLQASLYDGIGHIGGQAYFDVNQNGVIDPADTLISGVGLQLWQGSVLQQTLASNAQGGYVFQDLPAGQDYSVLLDTAALPFNLEAAWVQVDTTLEGCDAIITLDWLVGLTCSPTQDTLQFQVCPDEFVEYNGQSIGAGESMAFHLVSHEGCDSTVVVNVQELPTYLEALEITACEGEPADFNGMPLEPGQYTFTFPASGGCDSVIQLTVAELPADTVRKLFFACPGDAVDFHGISLAVGEEATVVLANQQGCDSVAYARVEAFPLPVVEVEVQQDCPGPPSGALAASISAGTVPPYSYALNDGPFSESPAFPGLEGGQYILHARDGRGCEVGTEVQVPSTGQLQIIIIPDSITCEEPVAFIEAEVLSGGENGLEYSWSDGIPALSREVETPGTYTLTADNGCEQFGETIQVAAARVEEGRLFYIPNAFSPNDDGINDLFGLYANPDVQILSLDFQVFSRWGTLLYHSGDWKKRWDGTTGGRALGPGVYTWFVKAAVMACGQRLEVFREGDVTLVR